MIMVNNSPVGIIVPKCFKLPIACDIEYGLKDQIVFKTWYPSHTKYEDAYASLNIICRYKTLLKKQSEIACLTGTTFKHITSWSN